MLISRDVILGDGLGVEEQTIEVAGAPVFYRRAPAAGPTTLYLHSVPTSSDDWESFLPLTGGIALDLVGFGRSSKAIGLDYSLGGYADFLERFLAALEVDQIALVGHGWGAAIGLAFAQRHPERIERLAIIDAVPLLAGFTWPRVVRRLRPPGMGELLMGLVNKRRLARTLRAGSASPEAWPAARINQVWEQFDQGTQRAILRLHRSIDAPSLAAAGSDLDELDCPALVVWGERDPWLNEAFADAYAARLSRATVQRAADAGHWPWLDQPELIGQIAAFLAGPEEV